MPYLFEHLDAIEKLIRQAPFGLVTDIDGTISQTAPTPQQAEVSPVCRHYLSLLCHNLALVAAVSGRPVAQMRDMIGIDGLVYVGNHGLERWVQGHSEFIEHAGDYSKTIKAVIEGLKPLFSREGILIENKGVTASVHYRLCPEPEAARQAIMTSLTGLPQAGGLRIIQGRKVIDLLPKVAANKGIAMLDMIHRHNLHRALYLGDDLTDVDAFRAVHAASQDSDFHGFAIGVISQEMPEEFISEVDFTLNGVNDVECFLKWLSETVVPPT